MSQMTFIMQVKLIGFNKKKTRSLAKPLSHLQDDNDILIMKETTYIKKQKDNSDH